MSVATPALEVVGAGHVAQPNHPRLLRVSSLSVSFPGAEGRESEVVSELSYEIAQGETLGVVGESGCGKTMTSLAIMGLLPSGAKVSGSIEFDGKDLTAFSPRQWRSHRGREVAMVFQEPMTAMNPVMKVGQQIAEVLVKHERLSRRAAFGRAVELLASVHIPSPERRAQDYPHQLSGGMRQRAMIAMALACRPKLLVADEPTTALDVTVQAQILDLMLELQETYGTAIQFISHNLAVVSEVAHRIMVMYSGRIVEYAPAEDLFSNPLHPYTQGLIRTLPDIAQPMAELYTIPGSVGGKRPSGCRFSNRCPLGDARCREAEPALREVMPRHHVACFKVN
ncbi:ABC transporter ATP-binding protein [Chelativorans alearense]|uniref:ABC transporter ATP-binding protein n=1 Tax=Chelativorans alearense TaxID=2681495 RepID=UPI0013D19E33|nr:ABC transporter ATP-binding protein [Chelativorans alearense]